MLADLFPNVPDEDRHAVVDDPDVPVDGAREVPDDDEYAYGEVPC